MGRQEYTEVQHSNRSRLGEACHPSLEKAARKASAEAATGGAEGRDTEEGKRRGFPRSLSGRDKLDERRGNEGRGREGTCNAQSKRQGRSKKGTHGQRRGRDERNEAKGRRESQTKGHSPI